MRVLWYNKTMKQYLRIVILGPQGAGKGTQAALLARHYHVPHISAGDLLRAESRRGTKLGKRIASIIDNGKLVPDNLMSLVVGQRLRRRDAQRGWIIDGYPRFKAQAKSFNRIAKPAVVVALQLSDKSAIQRLAGRRVCPRGHVYHLRYDRPRRRPGFCDRDNLPLTQRADDTPSAIKKRLRWHHAQTDPLISVYHQQGILLKVDARPSISAVYRDLLSRLKRFSWPSSQPTGK
jgi:adenylate kinase